MFLTREIIFLKPSIKRLLSIALLVFSNNIYAGPGYLGCVAACIATCLAAPIAIPGCIPGCPLGCIAACFSSNTKFVICRKEDYINDTGLCLEEALKEVSAEEVKVGDFVQTIPMDLKLGTPIYTEVVQNKKSHGDYKFINIKLGYVDAAQDNEFISNNLELTEGHQVVVLKRNTDAIDDNENSDEKAFVLNAKEVQKGMLLATLNGVQRVMETEVTHYPVKYSIFTKSGTVLASGIFTTAICDGTIDNGSNFLDAIKQHQELHQIQYKYMTE